MKHLVLDGSDLSAAMKGVGRYSFHVLAQLDSKLGPEWALHVLLFDWALPALPFSSRVHFIRIMPCTDFYKGFVVLPALCRKLQADLLFTPMEALLAFTKVPRIAVCHDINELIWIAQGFNPFSWRAMLNGVQQWLFLRGLRKCVKVICNSEYVRGEVIRRYRIESSRTLVGYCGVDQAFRYDPSLVPVGELVVGGRQLRPGYLLAFATGDVRENSELLPAVLALVKREINAVHLVIAGITPGSASVMALTRLFAAQGLQERVDYSLVRFLGEAEIADLAALYRNAALYLELSSHEGFGMQLAEAMASGIRCVSGRGGALAEVGGPHVAYFEARSVPAIAQAVVRQWRHQSDANSLQAQVEFTSRYSWDVMGNQICQLLAACAP